LPVSRCVSGTVFSDAGPLESTHCKRYSGAMNQAGSHDILVSLEGITKAFPGVIANDDVSLEVRAGEVHALLGENGAGKTSLMSVLYGIYQPDAGRIKLGGQEVRIRSPQDAMRLGVGLVAQHPMLVRRHTVAENIALAVKTGFFHPTRELEGRIKELGQRYSLAVDPNAFVWQLSAGEQQRVEILKALLRGARVLILDEPTSVLTPQEAEELFKVLERMKLEGHAVIIITHKLDEVMRVADRITVLRKGRVVGRMDTPDTNKRDLAKLMVGRELTEVRSTGAVTLGANVLGLDGLWVDGDRGVPVVKNFSLELRGGEVLGLAGVAGNGQRELIEAITGLRRAHQGRVLIGDADLTGADARGFAAAGVAHIPEDRFHMGVVGNLSVAENLALRAFERAPFSKGQLLDNDEINAFAVESIKRYEVATPGPNTRTRLLSGGNVQKVILARELAENPKLIVAAHPTYGLDAGATAQVQQLLLERARAGAGVLLVSEDLEEVMNLSDRIAVIFAGELMGIVSRNEASIEGLGLMMAGQLHGVHA
jgi:general nucleoside transport system ATP-binding protein